MSINFIHHANFSPNEALLFKMEKAYGIVCSYDNLKNSVNVKFVDDIEMKNLNKKFRNINKPTNVLSFTNDPTARKISQEIGDIAINFEYVKREASNDGKNFEDHMVHMLVHGIYHIIGMDHADDTAANRMEKKEIETLKKLNINNPY